VNGGTKAGNSAARPAPSKITARVNKNTAPAPAKTPCTIACSRFGKNPAAKKLSKQKNSSGRPASETMLVSATAGIAEMRHSRSSMPKIAKEEPAATNIISPRKPCAPIVCSASMPMITRPATIARPPRMRRSGSFSWRTRLERMRPPSAAHDGWMIAPWPSGT
jgi:hypothetical protein